MSLFWEPRWVRKRFEVSGVEVVTCEDEVSKLILCPVCENIDEFCPEGKVTSKVREDILTFFSIHDLIHHLGAHKYLRKERRFKGFEEVEEEGVEEEEET